MCTKDNQQQSTRTMSVRKVYAFAFVIAVMTHAMAISRKGTIPEHTHTTWCALRVSEIKNRKK
jgi:hypothetical protein